MILSFSWYGSGDSSRIPPNTQKNVNRNFNCRRIPPLWSVHRVVRFKTHCDVVQRVDCIQDIYFLTFPTKSFRQADRVIALHRTNTRQLAYIIDCFDLASMPRSHQFIVLMLTGQRHTQFVIPVRNDLEHTVYVQSHMMPTILGGAHSAQAAKQGDVCDDMCRGHNLALERERQNEKKKHFSIDQTGLDDNV